MKMLVALPAIIFVHLIEIGLYAGVYALAIGPLQLGHFIPIRPMHCVHQIQMSLSLPFTDVTGVGRGALAQRSARPAPDAAEQEAALVVLPSELTLARLVEKLSRP